MSNHFHDRLMRTRKWRYAFGATRETSFRLTNGRQTDQQLNQVNQFHDKRTGKAMPALDNPLLALLGNHHSTRPICQQTDQQ